MDIVQGCPQSLQRDTWVCEQNLESGRVQQHLELRKRAAMVVFLCDLVRPEVVRRRRAGWGCSLRTDSGFL